MITLLQPDDKPNIQSLARELMPSLRHDFYYFPDEEILDLCLESNLSFGYFKEQQLMAYRLTYLPDKRPDNLLFDLNKNDMCCHDVAQFMGTLVHPDHQSKGVGQTLIKHNLEEIKKLGKRMTLVTIHPENKPSLAMAARCGFEIEKEAIKYGGFRRYILSHHTAF